jgi:excisionase family DNA binding protein
VEIVGMSEDWITTNEAAELAGYHPDHVRRLILAGKLEARRFGPVWAVSRTSVLAYLRQMEELGERRGPKTGEDET